MKVQIISLKVQFFVGGGNPFYPFFLGCKLNEVTWISQKKIRGINSNLRIQDHIHGEIVSMLFPIHTIVAIQPTP